MPITIRTRLAPNEPGRMTASASAPSGPKDGPAECREQADALRTRFHSAMTFNPPRERDSAPRRAAG